MSPTRSARSIGVTGVQLLAALVVESDPRGERLLERMCALGWTG